jgi:type I site-specific restriction endonuclease
MADATGDYLGPEAQARVDIDRQLTACGWVVQRYRKMNLGAGPCVAVREFPMAEGHGDADYLLFVDGKAVGVIEAKKKGSTLTGVEWQSAKYTTGLPDAVPALTKPLAFAYESTGVETRFTNGFDPSRPAGRSSPSTGPRLSPAGCGPGRSSAASNRRRSATGSATFHSWAPRVCGRRRRRRSATSRCRCATSGHER